MSGIVRSPLVGLVLLALFGGWSLLSHPDCPAGRRVGGGVRRDAPAGC